MEKNVVVVLLLLLLTTTMNEVATIKGQPFCYYY